MWSFIKWLFTREPDVIISRKPNEIYLRRWYIIPRNPIFNIYLHNFRMSDMDFYLHDHPWVFNISFLLKGSYKEYLPKNLEEWKNGSRKTIMKVRNASIKPIIRTGEAIHRIELFDDIDGNPKEVWTLFLTGPIIRSWGFYCNWGFRDHTEFLQKTDESVSITGLGCD